MLEEIQYDSFSTQFQNQRELQILHFLYVAELRIFFFIAISISQKPINPSSVASVPPISFEKNKKNF